MEPTFGEEYERHRRGPPDQAHRLRHDDHGLGRPRRARPWIAVAAVALLLAAFVVLLVSGGGENSQGGAGTPGPTAVAA